MRLGYPVVMEEEVIHMIQENYIHDHYANTNQESITVGGFALIGNTSFPAPSSSTTMLGNTPRFPMYSPSHHPSSMPLSSVRSSFIIAPSGNEISSSAMAEYS